jgi:hypothetical protein
MRVQNNGTFTSFFKDKKSKRSYKNWKSTFFLLFLLDAGRIWSRILVTNGSGCGSGSPKTYDPDPDPQHWNLEYLLNNVLSFI